MLKLRKLIKGSGSFNPTPAVRFAKLMTFFVNGNVKVAIICGVNIDRKANEVIVA